MSGSNHVAGGVVFTGVFLSMYDINIFSSPAFIFFTAFFSLLPDADHTKSFIGKLIYPVAKFVNRKYGHRTITHSLIFYIATYVMVSFIVKSLGASPIIPKIYLWAFGSHLIFDMLTKQGIPLFYPFKKNPCVMPANPIYRLRASDLKTEATIFLVFGLIAFTCKNLFAQGFWNTYNSAFDNVKHVYEEQKKFDGVIAVEYEFKNQKGTSYLVEANTSKVILFNPASGFLEVTDEEKIKLFRPIRTKADRKDFQISFNDITIDSFQALIKDKAIKDLKIQSSLPLSYSKDNQPQSSTSISLSYVFNPVFRSNEIDSIDLSIAKEIELTKQELSNAIQSHKIYEAQMKQYEQQKKEAIQRLTEVQDNITSQDLAVRERAIKDLPAAKSRAESFNQIKNTPVNPIAAINIKMNFLQSKLHIRKLESITGFISYFKIISK